MASATTSTDNGTLQGALKPPAVVFAAGSPGAHDAIPSSARTSFTHVNYEDDEHRPRQLLGQEPSVPAVQSSTFTPLDTTSSAPPEESTSGELGLERGQLGFNFNVFCYSYIASSSRYVIDSAGQTC